jgi:hypothetical protein
MTTQYDGPYGVNSRGADNGSITPSVSSHTTNVVYVETAFNSARAWSIWSCAYVATAAVDITSPLRASDGSPADTPAECHTKPLPASNIVGLEMCRRHGHLATALRRNCRVCIVNDGAGPAGPGRVGIGR